VEGLLKNDQSFVDQKKILSAVEKTAGNKTKDKILALFS
jgi:hypothetical protein